MIRYSFELLCSYLHIDHHINLALTGALPESIGNWESVTDVDMSENSFSSDSGLPTTIGNWKLIEKLQFFNSGKLLSSIIIIRLIA